jgi:hypothetical protein
LGWEGYNLILTNDLCNMWVGNLFSNMVTRNLAGWEVWLRLVCAMVWWLMMDVFRPGGWWFGLVLVPVGF